jgi:hypothetical protein
MRHSSRVIREGASEARRITTINCGLVRAGCAGKATCQPNRRHIGSCRACSAHRLKREFS